MVTVVVAIALFSSSPIITLEPNMVSYEDHIEQLWQDTMAGRLYVGGKYDCTQFTRDFVKILLDDGFEAYRVMGWHYKDSYPYGRILHEWVEVLGRDFEATTGLTYTGKFIDIYSHEYKKIRGGC